MRPNMVPVPSTTPHVRFLTLAACGLLAAIAALPIHAQSATANSKREVSAAPVTLDLVVSDKKGNTVPTLNAGELEVLEGGATLRVTDLHQVSGAPAAGRQSLVTLVFDQLDSGNAKNARDAALELLKSAPTTGMSFGVFRVAGRLRLLAPFTADREVLKHAIDNGTGFGKSADADCDAVEKQLQDDAKNAASPHHAEAEALLDAMLESQRQALNAHITPSVAALLGAAGTSSALPGRRTVVYFSQGLSYYRDSPETVRSIIDAANRSGVSIYSIDAHVVDSQASSAMLASVAIANAGAGGATGIAAGAGQGGPSAAGAGTGSMVGEQMGRIEMGDLGVSGPPLEAIAQTTGGSHVVTSGDVRRNVRKIAEDLTSYYVATIIPAASDGRFHRVVVKPLRAGLVLRVPAGYFAPPPPPPPATSSVEPALLQSLAQSTPPSDVALRASVIRFGASPQGVTHTLVVEAPSGAARLAVLAQLKDQSGAVVEKFSQDLAAPSAPGPITVQRHFTAAPGSYVLEAAVTDIAGGKTGAQHTNVEIPAAATAPALSDIVLVQRIEPFQGPGDPMDPLRCAEGLVVPELSAHVSRASTPVLTLFFQIRKDLKAGAPAKLSAEVRRDGVSIGAVPLALNAESREEVVPYLAKLGTASLKPGAYKMTVILEQGDAKSAQSVSFQLD